MVPQNRTEIFIIIHDKLTTKNHNIFLGNNKKMKKFFLIIVVLFVASVNAFAAEVTLKGLTKSSPLKQGFISHLYDEKSGKLYLKVNNIM